MTSSQVESYCQRLQIRQPTSPTLETLWELHLAHLRSIPFENLDIHLGVEISLCPEAMFDKLITRRRGGFCYELNGAFAALLHSLGFEVSLLEARVISEGRPLVPFDHLCLQVDLDEPWLCDVGFGDSFQLPLRLHRGVDQSDPNGTYRIDPSPQPEWLELIGGSQPQYRFSLEPRRLEDFEACCHHHQTSPESHFTRGTICSLLTAEGGRVSIRNRKLIETQAGERQEREISRDDELRDLYRERFGIELERLPI
ncbi:MAG: arylamine N-acetyltransferase [Acidobacteriota bacterium]